MPLTTGLQYDLFYAGQPPTFTESINRNVWETALSPAAAGKVILKPPFAAALSFKSDTTWGADPANHPLKMVLDTSVYCPVRRKLGTMDPTQPVIAQIAVDLVSVVFNDTTNPFHPKSYFARHKKVADNPTQRQALLSGLQSGTSDPLGVSPALDSHGNATDTLGVIGPSAATQPVIVRCYLDDGSVVPLSWALSALQAYATAAAKASPFVAQRPTYVQPDGTSVPSQLYQGLHVKALANPKAPLAPVGGPYSVLAQPGAQPDPARDVTVMLAAEAQHAVIPIDAGNAATISIKDDNGQVVSAGLAGAAPTASVAVTSTQAEQDLVTALPAQTIVVMNPASSPAAVSSQTSVVTVKGAASVAAGMTVSVNGATPTAVPTANADGTFSVDVSLAGPATSVALTATDGATASLDIYQLDIAIGKLIANTTAVELEHSTAADPTHDSIRMAATVSGDSSLLSAATVQWQMKIDSSVPTRAQKLRPDSVGSTFGALAPYWIDFSMQTPDPSQTTGQSPSQPWDPGPLTLIDNSIACDQTGGTQYHDMDKSALGLSGPLTGADDSSAGPVLGLATLTASLTSPSFKNPVSVTRTVTVRGFNPYSISWSQFYARLRSTLTSSFGIDSSGNYTDKQFPALTVTLDQLSALMLGLMAGVESSLAQFWNSKQTNSAGKLTHPANPPYPAVVDGCNMINFGGPSGVGVGQYDAEDNAEGWRVATTFDWRENLDVAVAILADKFSYPVHPVKDETTRLTALLKGLPQWTSASSDLRQQTIDNLPGYLQNTLQVQSPALLGAITSDSTMLLHCRVKSYNGRLAPYRTSYAWQVSTDSNGDPVFELTSPAPPSVVNVCWDSKTGKDLGEQWQYDKHVFAAMGPAATALSSGQTFATLGDFYNAWRKAAGKNAIAHLNGGC